MPASRPRADRGLRPRAVQPTAATDAWIVRRSGDLQPLEVAAAAGRRPAGGESPPISSPKVPSQGRPRDRRPLRLAYRALGSFEQPVGWSPRLRPVAAAGAPALAARAGQRRPGRAAGRLGDLVAAAARRPAGDVVGRRRRHFARLLEACQRSLVGAAGLPRATRRCLPAGVAVGGRRPRPLA